MARRYWISRISGKSEIELRDELMRFGSLNAEDEERLWEIENSPSCGSCGAWCDNAKKRKEHEKKCPAVQSR